MCMSWGYYLEHGQLSVSYTSKESGKPCPSHHGLSCLPAIFEILRHILLPLFGKSTLVLSS